MAINLLSGIKLPKLKQNGLENDITEIRPADVYSVPTLCSKGYPTEVVVSVGDTVREGSLIAKPTTSRGMFIYSPVSGKVISVVDKFTPSGYKCPHVVIQNDKKNTQRLFPPMVGKSPKELLKRLALSGIVDANFGGTPTYLRYSLSAIEKNFDLYVLASNCDPYLSANEALVLHRTAEVVSGAKYFAKILGSKKIVFIFTRRAKSSAKQLSSYLKKHETDIKWTIRYISDNYPSDNIQLLREKFKPQKKLLVETDVTKAFVEDAITCYNFFNAVEYNRPIDYRVITVAGPKIEKGGNYIVKNGMSFEHVINSLCGDARPEEYKVLNGGIMTGLAEYTLDIASGPETQSITYLSGKDFDVKKELPCINCGKCVAVCPMNLLPNKLDELCLNRKNYDAEKMGIRCCIECGCCSYVCPSKRYLTQRIVSTKHKIEEDKQ